MSLEGISSSLRRMYQYFDIEDTKYKKVALIQGHSFLANTPEIALRTPNFLAS